MEHLDLAGVIGTPTMWSMPAFDQQDAMFLSSSRQMLEPILEETSEDEEHAQHSWNQYEQSTSFWSSAESETGSVIRVELNKDPDSISERDFACPAKRARRSDDFLIGGQLAVVQPPPTQSQPIHVSGSFDDTVLLRRYQRIGTSADFAEVHSNSLERFLTYEACARDSWGNSTSIALPQRNSTGSRRFADDFSDSDSLSYNSLSRSSSLIQFESLERQLQLQEQHASMTSLGNSSPSLLSFDGANSGGTSNEEGARSGNNSSNSSRRGSQSSLLKRFEAADGRLHQTYFDLDKLNFDDDKRVLFGSNKTNVMMEATVGEVRSDSESSTSSSDSSSGNSILTASKPSAEDLTDSGCGASVRAAGRIMAFQRVGKSSAENLSEDSGYCEPSTLRRAKSKSIPRNFEKFCEEEEEFQQYDYVRAAAEVDVEENVTKTDFVTAQPHSRSAASANNNTNNTINGKCNSATSPLIHYVAGHDICQPEINDATFAVLESNNDIARSTTPPPSSPPPLPSTSPPPSPTLSQSMAEGDESSYFGSVKNSPTREALLEQRRAMAHSPSPVSSDASGSSCCTSRSSASASTCASAASFTWLPTPKQQLQQRQQQQQQQQHQQIQLQLERAQLQQQLPPLSLRQSSALGSSQTLENFRASLRNSLPDIRDALSSEALFSTHNAHSAIVDERNGYGLEHLKEIPTTNSKTIAGVSTQLAALHVTDDSDVGTTSASVSGSASSSSSSRNSRSSDGTDGDSTPEIRKRNISNNNLSGLVVGGGVFNSGAVGYVNTRRRIASVPNELNRLGRKKRSTKYRQSKTTREDIALTSASESHSNSSADDEDDFFDDSLLKIRRSCSWSERRERERQRLDTKSLGYMNASYQDLTRLDYTSTQPLRNQTNLKRNGLLAESEGAQESDNMDTPKNVHSADYENIICKGNFLLDELSQIYDRNASILNDKPVDNSKVLHLPLNTLDHTASSSSGGGSSPCPPARHRKHSNSSYSDLESGGDDSGVQHVRLIIRKPQRQKQARKGEATYSLVGDDETQTQTTMTTTHCKTFDQDPTNLRTSYAQSLEKCNFDPKELSNSELNKPNALPKRRFHSQATATNQRNMVSSTPNLNAYDPRADEADDDMYVSSAHTSMHQLPQTNAPKPLGILLPAGSRTSFSKEVSFCPVVSQYSWQEQSSEEYNEQQQAAAVAQQKQEDDTDDELLDNADATVIYNTRENEMIAARYAVEEQRKAKSAQPIKSVAYIRAAPAEKLRAAAIILRERETTLDDDTEEEHTETSHESAAQNVADEKPVAVGQEVTIGNKHSWVSVVEAPRAIAAATVIDGAGAKWTGSQKSTFTDVRAVCSEGDGKTNVNGNRSATKRQNVVGKELNFENESGNRNPVNVQEQLATRPLSIHLPILSEPPTNRAHHILYGSQQMLDNFQRREREELEREQRAAQNQIASSGSVGERIIIDGSRRAKSVGNLSGTPTAGYVMSGSGAGGTAANNNNEMMKKKFKDEKHPSSKGFLSRFAHGLRFSLRRKKKQQLQQQQQQSAPELNGTFEKTEQVKVSGANAQQQQQQQQKSGKPQNKTGDIIHIPLKGPLPAGARSDNSGGNNDVGNGTSGNSATLPANFSPADAKVGAKAQQPTPAQHSPKSSNNNNNNHNEPLVTGKPPLPHRHASMPSTTSSSTIMTKYFGGGGGSRRGSGQHPQPGHAQKFLFGSAAYFKSSSSPQSRSKFYTDFLDAERAYYSDTAADGAGEVDTSNAEPQLQTGAYTVQPHVPQDDTDRDNSSDDVIATPDAKQQDTVMLLTGAGAGASVGAAAGASSVGAHTTIAPTSTTMSDAYFKQQQYGNNFNNSATHTKIGLIETNLDTHETVISGKTRSLVDIVGGPQHQTLAVYGGGKRLLQRDGNEVLIYDDDDGDADDAHVYGVTHHDDDVVGGGTAAGGAGGRGGIGVVVVKSTTSNGSQIASVRRPHKSMEFLLDKENQKTALVRIKYLLDLTIKIFRKS